MFVNKIVDREVILFVRLRVFTQPDNHFSGTNRRCEHGEH